VNKHRLAMLTCSIMIAGLTACGGKEETAKKVSNENQTEQKEDQKEFKTGETIQLGDYKLTVTNVEKSQGGEFDKPKDGNEFVIATIKIENGGKKEISYNPLDFSLQNSDGNIVDSAFTTVNEDTALSHGKLTPKGTISGSIAFETKQGDSKLQLIFKPNFLSKKKVAINLY